MQEKVIRNMEIGLRETSFLGKIEAEGKAWQTVKGDWYGDIKIVTEGIDV